VTTWPVNPEPGVSNNVAVVTVKVSDIVPCTMLVASVSLTVYGMKLAVFATVKLPDRMPYVSMVQLTEPSEGRAGTTEMPGLRVEQSREDPPVNPDPDSMTNIPLPPLFGVNSNLDRTMNSALAMSPVWPTAKTL
jgi:hypothetical protein